MRNLLYCLGFVMTVTLAIELPCRYAVGTDSRIRDLYFCDLNNSLTIPNSSIQITSITGEHMPQKSTANVVGFRATNKTLHFLPHGLEKYFNAEKIQFLQLEATGLKQIRPIDLKPFTEMIFFSAWGNELRALERDLFKFNPKLRFIGLGKNKLQFIDGFVFNNLNYLDTVYLDSNVCTDDFVNAAETDNYKDKLMELNKRLRANCSPYS